MTKYADLKGFEQFMVQRDLVPEAHRSFYVRWVRRFLSAEFAPSELENRDKVECFADQLARDASVEEWQLRQALKAVALFLDVYLKEVNGRGRRAAGMEDLAGGSRGGAGGTPAVRGRQVADGGVALAEMKKLLLFGSKTI